MGAWDELDTEISVEVDTSDLDSLMNIDDPYGIFEDVVNYAEDLAEAIDEGSKDGLDQIATVDRSLQEQALQKCKNPSGVLSSSINVEEEDDYTFIVGTTINEIYPLCIEFGRDEVHPIPPNTRLKFYGEDGYIIYPKMSAEADPVPFVAPAYDSIRQKAGELMLRNVMHKVNDIK